MAVFSLLYIPQNAGFCILTPSRSQVGVRIRFFVFLCLNMEGLTYYGDIRVPFKVL